MRSNYNTRKKPFLSIVIPVEKKTRYLEEALVAFSKQTYTNFELIVASSVPMRLPQKSVRIVVDKNLSRDVASKRNEILKYGKGEIFIFSDDDVHAPIHYLENVVFRMSQNRSILASCGPLLTPLSDTFWQRASGAVWESFMGSVGAGIYRSRLSPSRIVYDYPAANLIVRRDVFKKVGGFQKGIYPGEDTRLCLDILTNCGAGVFYDPHLFVFHHRKPLFVGHLVQIGRYGWQRGWFSLSFPKTSFKIQYFLPTALFLYFVIVLCSLVLTLFFKPSSILVPVYYPGLLYFSLILLEAIGISYSKGIRIGAVSALGIIATHLYYGYQFLISFVVKIAQKMSKSYYSRKK